MDPFDTAIVRCPKCSYPNELPTKAGICDFEEWDLLKAPAVIQADIAHQHNDFQCDNCGYIGRINIQTVVSIS